MKNLHKELSQDIEFITNKSLIYYDHKRLRGLILKKGDPVYLLQKKIKMKRLNMKLDYTKLNLYRIQKVLGSLTYRLKLP
jgi:hypothetical protein